MHYKIGTRGSKLALTQTEMVRAALAERFPEHTFENVVITTTGDRQANVSLRSMGGKGVFVQEIEEALTEGRLDMAVHSMKDMPDEKTAGLSFVRAWKREDPRDVLILREASSLMELRQGAVIGTGSRRRSSQLLQVRPDLTIVDIRGNVDTRLRKMQEQQLDGIVLAAAGLKRLGMESVITEYLPDEVMVHAPAQGTLAIQVREDRAELIHMLETFSDPDTETAVQVERRVMRNMGGGCHAPIGASCYRNEDGTWHLNAFYSREDETHPARISLDRETQEELIADGVRELTRQVAGVVTLVGAGPGDPGLITVRGLEKIRKADCILYDRLIAPELLEEAKPGCELIYVGKADKHHTMPQGEIQELLVEKARQYDHVVRLKGGDVYVFGRGGEEAAWLKEYGVSCEILNGISSSIAGPASAGIPVTHRGLATGFRVVTAHTKDAPLEGIDWESMAHGQETCLFLMGLSQIGAIAERLIAAGMDPEMPAAVISKATMPDQRTCVGTLTDIADRVREAALPSPAIIVVGRTVALREELPVAEATRVRTCWVPKIEDRMGESEALCQIPGERFATLASLLRRPGRVIREVTIGEIRPVEVADISGVMTGITWLVFSSKHGVSSYMKQWLAGDQDLRALAGVKLAVVGKKTADVLRAWGLKADLVAQEATLEGLAKELAPLLTENDRILHPTNALGSDLAALLPEHEVHAVIVYENRDCSADAPAIAIGAEDVVYFTSASAAERFIGMMEPESRELWKMRGTACGIGPKTAAKLQELGVRTIRISETASYEALAAMEIE